MKKKELGQHEPGSDQDHDDSSSSQYSSEDSEKEKQIDRGLQESSGPRQVSFRTTVEQQDNSGADSQSSWTLTATNTSSNGYTATEKEEDNDRLDPLHNPSSTHPNTTTNNSNSHPQTRPQLSERATTQASAALTTTRSLPRLKRKETKMMQKHAHPWEHLGITLGLPAILIFDIVLPCIIYYTWYYTHLHRWQRQCRSLQPNNDDNNNNPSYQACPLPKPEFDEDILGYAIISFGFGELWILIARVWRLLFRTQDCAPLLSRNKWELDATSWVYGVAMILALIPFVIGSSLVMPHLYLYSPSCLMGFLGVLMVITTFVPFKLPIGINSHARGTRLRPFIYYAAEDFIAVDGLQDREFRIRYNERYETNKAFRRMFLYLTLWWILGVATYVGAVSAVIWTLEFHIAFGLSLGVLFGYIAVWAACSAVYVRWEINRQHRAFDEGKFDG